MKALKESPNAPFTAYNDMRLPDVHALHDLAYYLNLNFSLPGKFLLIDIQYRSDWKGEALASVKGAFNNREVIQEVPEEPKFIPAYPKFI